MSGAKRAPEPPRHVGTKRASKVSFSPHFSDQLQTPTTLPISERFSMALIMKSATSAYEILKAKAGRCPTRTRYLPVYGLGVSREWRTNFSRRSR
jgi:hypothetical protein